MKIRMLAFIVTLGMIASEANANIDDDIVSEFAKCLRNEEKDFNLGFGSHSVQFISIKRQRSGGFFTTITTTSLRDVRSFETRQMDDRLYWAVYVTCRGECIERETSSHSKEYGTVTVSSGLAFRCVFQSEADSLVRLLTRRYLRP